MINGQVVVISDVLLKIKKYLFSNIPEDTLPILVAIIDPDKVLTSVTIQKEYPLTLIERNYGIPFGRLRSDSDLIISDSGLLHQFKWNFGVHISEFESDAMNELFVQTNELRKVVSILSTGIGNLLQNKRSVAYLAVDRFFSVDGEDRNSLPPYTCLVAWKDKKLSIELLRFSDNFCRLVDKKLYMSGRLNKALENMKKIGTKIKWAVSGYPLVLASKKVPLDEIAQNVFDLRHLWQLPMLNESISKYLKEIVTDKKLEFFFGFDRLRENDLLLKAINDEVLCFELKMAINQFWKDTLFEVCNIDERIFNKCKIYYKPNSIVLKKKDIKLDFINNGYTYVNSKNRIKKRGQFTIINNMLYVKLIPAPYPHHIVGLLPDGKLINISIGGLSGRTGITIEGAQKLCMDLELTDALIFDNGFDVVAQLGGIQGSIIRHKQNIRQTRLTAALHFGRVVQNVSDEDFGGYFDGFNLGYCTYKIAKN